MRQKQIKKLRKELKKTNGFTLSRKDGYKADYRVAKEKKVMAYFDKTMVVNGKTFPTGDKVAVEAKRVVIVNASKTAYRRIKKDFAKIIAKKG